MHFVPFPGPSSSGDKVLGQHTLPRCSVSYHLPGPSPLVSWVRHESTTSDVPCVSSAELIFATLLVDVNCPGSQEDLVSNWEPAHSLVEDAISGAEIAPRLLALAVIRLPPCLQQGMGWSAAG